MSLTLRLRLGFHLPPVCCASNISVLTLTTAFPGTTRKCTVLYQVSALSERQLHLDVGRLQTQLVPTLFIS
jgi:hypothetical protein